MEQKIKKKFLFSRQLQPNWFHQSLTITKRINVTDSQYVNKGP